MNCFIDLGYFEKLGISQEKVNKMIERYPNCIMVKNKEEYRNHNYPTAWYKGTLILATDGFGLGNEVFFDTYEYTHYVGQEPAGIFVNIGNAFHKIPPYTGNDSTASEFYNLEYYRQKRVYERERDLGFEMVWALNRVAYLRKKRFNTQNACKRVAEQSGLDYQNILNKFYARCAHLKWGAKDYKKRETN